jgi:hypothetical protein
MLLYALLTYNSFLLYNYLKDLYTIFIVSILQSKQFAVTAPFVEEHSQHSRCCFLRGRRLNLVELQGPIQPFLW